jgi:hypothetical protein
MRDRRGNGDYRSHSITGISTMQNGNKQNVCTIMKLAGLTTCGTSAAVAMASQITPWRYQMQWVNSIITNKNGLTCFQRTYASSRKALSRWRRRNKPTSMMSSRLMSVTSVLMVRSLMALKLVVTHALAIGTHTARPCWWIRQEGQRIEKDYLL